MLEQLAWWVLPSVAALILVATHTYLGLHVISRNVLFVDLALAQLAALGSSVAFLYGFELSDPITYWVSLGFALLGAWFFSVARLPGDRVPQEAVIGLAFAAASSGAVLLSAHNPHGAEHLRDMLTGSILVVSGGDVAYAAGIYGAIGVVHWVLRKPLLLVSLERERAIESGMRVRLWDFVFYASFALIITSSVRIAGVLLVFVLLIAPAVGGAMLASDVRSRLLIGWASGITASIAGLVLSARMDWPPAPAIACVFVAILIVLAVLGHVLLAQRRLRLLARVALTFVALSAVAFGFERAMRSAVPAQVHAEEEHSHGPPEHPHGSSRSDLLAALHDEHEQVRAAAAKQLGAHSDPSVLPQLVAALSDPSAAVKEAAAQALGQLGRPEAIAALEAALAHGESDEWVTLHEAEALASCGGARGISALLELAQNAEAKLVREQALRIASERLGRPAAASNDASFEKTRDDLVRAWSQSSAAARWDAPTRRFVTAR